MRWIQSFALRCAASGSSLNFYAALTRCAKTFTLRCAVRGSACDFLRCAVRWAVLTKKSLCLLWRRSTNPFSVFIHCAFELFHDKTVNRNMSVKQQQQWIWLLFSSSLIVYSSSLSLLRALFIADVGRIEIDKRWTMNQLHITTGWWSCRSSCLKAPRPTPRTISASGGPIGLKIFTRIETDQTRTISKLHPIKVFERNHKNILLRKK